MTTKGELRDAAAALLMGATDAGSNIYTPSDWATYDSAASGYPVILVSAPSEQKRTSGERGTLDFVVVATLAFTAKVEVPAGPADVGAMIAEAALERLELQILKALIGNPAFMAHANPDHGQRISDFPAVSSQIRVSSEGEQHIAELLLQLDVEFWQGVEDFYDPDGVALTQIAINDPTAAAQPPAPSGRLLIALEPPECS